MVSAVTVVSTTLNTLWRQLGHRQGELVKSRQLVAQINTGLLPLVSIQAGSVMVVPAESPAFWTEPL